MTERPILFNDEMVNAILAGQKTVTRRAIKSYYYFGCFTGDCPHERAWECDHAIQDYAREKSRYGQTGDRLWVREAFNKDWCDHIIFRADSVEGAVAAGYAKEPRWRPSIHMSRKDSRINLEIIDVGVERVQDITSSEVLKEGLRKGCCALFKCLWDEINGERGFSWKSNPLVWRIEFKVIS